MENINNEKKEVVLYENDMLKVVNYTGISKNGKPYDLLVTYIKTKEVDIPLQPRDNLGTIFLKNYFNSLNK